MSKQQHFELVEEPQDACCCCACCSCRGAVHHYKTSASKILGGVGIVTGVACIGLQIAALVVYSSAWSSVFMQGIWCGAAFILAGAFAVVAGSKNVRGFIITSMVLNIFALLLAIPVIGLSIFGVDGDDQLTDLKYYETKPEESKYIIIALIVFGGIEGIVALGCAILACMGVCR